MQLKFGYRLNISTMCMLISDKAGSQIAELCTDLITQNSVGETPYPVKMALLGTLPLCAVPLACIQLQPVFGVREATVSEQSVWSQLLSSLTKKCLVLVRKQTEIMILDCSDRKLRGQIC